MCGIAKQFGDPAELIGQQLRAAEDSGMPVDPRLWLEAAPRSSHPACLAVKAAAEQGDPARYLRRLREGFQLRRRKLDTADALTEEARGILDLERFAVDLRSNAILEAFAADLERAALVPQIPMLTFGGPGATAEAAGPSQLRDAALAAGAVPGGASPPGIEDALGSFENLATAEVAAICDLPGPRAPAELWRLASEWRIKAERFGSGELWSLA